MHSILKYRNTRLLLSNKPQQFLELQNNVKHFSCLLKLTNPTINLRSLSSVAKVRFTQTNCTLDVCLLNSGNCGQIRKYSFKFNKSSTLDTILQKQCRKYSNKIAPILAPTVKLNNGYEMPVLGFGTYESLAGDCERAVGDAIDAGYRHIDTAYFYENEHEVGKAVRDKIAEGVIKREDIFIVTKLWCHFHEPERVEYACRKSLENFGLDYVDCYLMHWPYAYVHRGDDVMMPTNSKGDVELSDVDYLDTWKAMEALVEKGLVKSIGVSNFNSEQLTRLLANCKIKPIHNQIECHPGLNQKPLIALCKKHDIVVTAYCPLGRPQPAKKTPVYLFDDKVKAIADKYKKSPAQVVLRYLIENGAVPIPKSVNKKRIMENFSVFDFKLSPEDHKILDSYNTGVRLIPMDHAKKSIHYPFNIEY